ncbi:hypothetical protein LINPERHAP1_LOCUS14425 [Linum perenne]
MSFSSIG